MVTLLHFFLAASNIYQREGILCEGIDRTRGTIKAKIGMSPTIALSRV